MKPYLKKTLLSFFALTAASGLFLGMNLLWSILYANHDLLQLNIRNFILKMHIFSAMALVFTGGAIMSAHAIPHIMRKTHKAGLSGRSLFYFMFITFISGFSIQTVSNPDILQWVRVAHLAVGLLFTVLLVLHIYRAVKTRAVKTFIWLFVVFSAAIVLFFWQMPEANESENPTPGEAVEEIIDLDEMGSLEPDMYRSQHLVMGTRMNIDIFNSPVADVVENEILTTVKRIESILSSYNPDSELSMANANAGKKKLS